MRLRTNRIDSPSHIAHRYTPIIYAFLSTAEEADGRDLAQDACHESQRDLRDLHGRVQGTTDWCLPLIPNLLVDSQMFRCSLRLASAFPDCKPACTHGRSGQGVGQPGGSKAFIWSRRPAGRMLWQPTARLRHRAPIIAVMLAGIYAVGQQELAAWQQ